MKQSVPSQRLAIVGGRPIRSRAWPMWPRSDKSTEKLVLDVLHSNRWTISGYYTGHKPYERKFAEAFAHYNKTKYCVPTSSGSAALAIALQAIGVGYGDEVLVPGLTWVACASAVVALGAVPVFVDIDPLTLCMSPVAAAQSITPRTKAIMLVHLYCGVADIDAFLALARRAGLLHDAAQMIHSTKTLRINLVNVFGPG
jgi:dTDP-4-amino-4,6-dideoxygalactose transaminase